MMLLLVSCLMAVGGSDAVKCYNCWSTNRNSACADPFITNGVGIPTCEGAYCVKEWGTYTSSRRVQLLGRSIRGTLIDRLLANATLSKNSDIAPQGLMQADLYGIERSCALPSSSPSFIKNECTCELALLGQNSQACVCNKDLCNSAKRPYTDMYFLIAVSAVYIGLGSSKLAR